jgi:hypothetical protein
MIPTSFNGSPLCLGWHSDLNPRILFSSHTAPAMLAWVPGPEVLPYSFCPEWSAGLSLNVATLEKPSLSDPLSPGVIAHSLIYSFNTAPRGLGPPVFSLKGILHPRWKKNHGSVSLTGLTLLNVQSNEWMNVRMFHVRLELRQHYWF